MNFLRRHWYDIGGVAGIILMIYICVWHQNMPDYTLLMWLSLISLLFHQAEEYRIPGTFPGMINRVMFRSDLPDRYPLNSNTSFWINVGAGWSVYLLAAILNRHAIWLGIAAIMVSLGNIIAHTFIFNIKGKTWYNAGLATSWLFLAPCVFFFFYLLIHRNLSGTSDFLIGIPLGLALNIFGILKAIRWLADRDTSFIFDQRQLLPADQLKH